MSLFKNFNGINGLEKSYYNEKVLEKIDEWYPAPLHFGVKNNGMYNYKYGFDRKFCYTMVLRDFKNEKVPVITIADNWVEKQFLINLEILMD